MPPAAIVIRELPRVLMGVTPFLSSRIIYEARCSFSWMVLASFVSFEKVLEHFVRILDPAFSFIH
jgi:uncharacterized membrane protein